MTLKDVKNILIVGLGLLGGSYAKVLTEKGFSVKTITLNQDDIDYAVGEGFIKGGSTTVDEALIKEAELIIFALYPHTFIEWIEENGNLIKSGTVITDVTGVKGAVVEKIQDMLPVGVEFIAAHPMAGKETCGVRNTDPQIFKKANYIVVPTNRNTPDAIRLCCDLGRTLGFADISSLTVRQHDEMIAFLSQLTHCIAVSLMCANGDPNLVRYTGDSFRDLTRIANINDDMWSELFLSNREALLYEMDGYRKTFDRLYDTIKNNDREAMREMMRLSSARRKTFNEGEKLI
ncbi:MAG: prephenate dehydrogenase [Clostridia bacterium]|nr:prephenate dehydrogenase [Clostridia bacterium]